MAYMSQQKKQALAPQIKKICKNYGIKATLAVDNHSTLVLNIKSGPIDFASSMMKVAEENPSRFHNDFVKPNNYISVNPYHFQNHFEGKALEFLSALMPAMHNGNHDNSDVMSDYFDVGWYVDINIGKWDKPYILEE